MAEELERYLRYHYYHGGRLSRGDFDASFDAYASEERHVRTQSIVDTLIRTPAGKRVVDCEGFTALVQHLVGRATNGKMTTFAVSVPGHVASVAIETKPNGRWFFFNNDSLEARGDLDGDGRLDEQAVVTIAETIVPAVPFKTTTFKKYQGDGPEVVRAESESGLSNHAIYAVDGITRLIGREGGRSRFLRWVVRERQKAGSKPSQLTVSRSPAEKHE